MDNKPNRDDYKTYSDYKRMFNRWRSRLPEVKIKRRLYEVKKTYGLEPKEYAKLENAGCSVCGNNSKTIHIDHCHTTGKTRGGLCSNCNTSLGLMGEDIKKLKQLISYIKKYKNN
jgi:hypothetical protein